MGLMTHQSPLLKLLPQQSVLRKYITQQEVELLFLYEHTPIISQGIYNISISLNISSQ